MPVPTAQDPDWSDSDDDERSDVETNVLLGLPDGQIERDEDIRDAAVSRIGGRPVRTFIVWYLCIILIVYTHTSHLDLLLLCVVDDPLTLDRRS